MQRVEEATVINCWLFMLCAHSNSLAKGALIWLHLSKSPSKVLKSYYEAVAVLIQNCRIESWKYFGKNVSRTWWNVYFLFQTTIKLVIAKYWYLTYCMANFLGKFGNHYPKGKLLQFASMHAFVFPVNLCMQPIKYAFTVFINSSSNGRQHL